MKEKVEVVMVALAWFAMCGLELVFWCTDGGRAKAQLARWLGRSDRGSDVRKRARPRPVVARYGPVDRYDDYGVDDDGRYPPRSYPMGRGCSYPYI